MRAFAVRSFGEPASVQDLPVPVADGAVLIRVRFAGVNPLDNNLLGRLTAARYWTSSAMAACAARPLSAS
jgi:NADPH:quinone reductase-like Zn-dependent oxidoreductase